MSPMVSRVQHGTVLRTLFLSFINDLTVIIAHNATLFADSCVIYRPIKSDHDVHILESDFPLVT